MEGGAFLQRESLNKKELAAGVAIHDKDESKRRQMLADVEASEAGKMLDDISHAKGSRKTLNVKHDKDGYIESVDNTKEVTWRDPKTGKEYHMSRAKANELLADAGMHGAIGKAAGIAKQTDNGKDMSVLSSNAMGAEAGNIESLNSAIKAAGGIDGFVAFKGASSAIQTTEAIGGTKGKLEEALKKEYPGMSETERKKIADAIVSGSTEGAEKFKKALSSLGGLAETMSAGKTGKDFNTVSSLNKWNSKNGGYIGAMEESGYAAGISTMGSLANGMQWTKKTAHELDQKFQKGIKEGKWKKEDLKDFYKDGIVKDGNIKDSWDLAEAFSMHAAGNKQGMHGIVIGDKSVGVAVSKNGIRISSIDDSTTEKTGDATQLNITQGVQKRAIEKAREKLGPNASESEVLKRAHEYAQQTAINESKANPVQDASLFSAINQVDRKHNKPNQQNKDKSFLDKVEDTGNSMLYYANDHLTEGIGIYLGNKALGNPIGKGGKKVWNGMKKVGEKLSPFSRKEETFDETTNSTQNNSNNHQGSETNDNMKQPHDNSFHSNSKTNSTTKQDLKQQISKKQDDLDSLYDKGKINDDEYLKKFMKYDNLKEKVDDGHININELKSNGIDTGHLSTDDKGFIDFAKSDESALKAKRAIRSAKFDKSGKVYGFDPNGNIREYSFNDGRSRAAYLRNNVGMDEPLNLEHMDGFGAALEPDNIEPKITMKDSLKFGGRVMGGFAMGAFADYAFSKITGQHMSLVDRGYLFSLSQSSDKSALF